MTSYETFRSNAAELPIMRRWVFFGLILSILLHAGILYYFYLHRVEFDAAQEQLAPPRVFNMKRVSLPTTPETPDEKLKLPDRATKLAPVAIPADKPEVSEVQVAPQISDPTALKAFDEKPKVDMAALDQMTKANASSRNEMDKELNTIAQSLIKDSPRSLRQPTIAIGGGGVPAAGAGDSNVSIPGLASVDDMLSHTGALHAGDKAGMPGGALFEYDHFDLRPESMAALQKLGALIQKNPRATFSIEGHTDSFGPADYNQKLSELRAVAVRDWLILNMGIDPSRIQTRGYGNTRPLVPADRSKEEQAPNRRVEIIVKTNRSRG
jgi:outer membrane protein OmpA-like peptidoglycan-associated protein